MTEPKPNADDSARTKQLINDTCQQAIRDMQRLDIATSIATGVLASQGFPFEGQDSQEIRKQKCARLAKGCYLVADALLAEGKTQRISRDTINRELVNAVASEIFSTTERAG